MAGQREQSQPVQNEFDQFADSYDKTLKAALPAGLDEDHYFAQYKIDFVTRASRKRKIDRILDFGCGAGRSLECLGVAFPRAHIYGYDPSAESLRVASQRVPQASLTTDWDEIQRADFDLVLAANVFHHIQQDQIAAWLERCAKVLSRDGKIFVFEHNPLNPLTRYVFDRCPFDASAKMIPKRELLRLGRKAGLRVDWTRYTLFFPKPLKMLRPLEQWLGWLPIGAQYCVEFGV
jgi:ubiquinone/menaquinone biosynthesis C-methylase UbiE